LGYKMDYNNFIWSTATFIEARVKEPIVYEELEKVVGFSYRHIRETFKECTGISLYRYILQRKLANSAFDIVHTQKSLTEIASDYMFDSYDTYTRAFKRYTSFLPSELRKRSCNLKVGRARIIVGMFGPMIIKDKAASIQEPTLSMLSGEIKHKPEEEKSLNNMEKTKDSCILYGVPKVAYSEEECTPFCAAFKACLNYMGLQIDYAYIMAITGAAFRLRWNTAYWDGGNVDIMNIYEDRYEAFRRAFQSAGRSYQILAREGARKEDFINLIKSEINEGRPVIAFGIIGPPEACLITGYRDDGNTLLGWNCFQDNQEYAKNVGRDESGYFITDGWWENECTVALIAVGESQEPLASHKEILTNAIDILTKEKITFYDVEGKPEAEYAGGQLAYDYWANWIGNDKEFPDGAILPFLYERIVCHNDALTMLGEGRYYAGAYLDQVAREEVSVAKECGEAAQYFRMAAELGLKMMQTLGAFIQDEANTRSFAEAEIRHKLVPLILKAKEYEAKACELLREIVGKL
jgi:AraC-like DNA-binding protein